MSEQGPIVTAPKRKRGSPEMLLAALSVVGLVGFVITFIVVMRAPADAPAAAPQPATFAQRVAVAPGEQGARGPAGPVGPRGPVGDPGIRIVRNDCGTATCSVECNEDEMVLTAHCGAARLPATFNSDREATCRLPVMGPRRIDVVAACVKITKR